jgi:release factor glutamine methyltransferase
LTAIAKALARTAAALGSKDVEDPAFEARVLVEEVLGVAPGRLPTLTGRHLTAPEERRLTWAVARRNAGVPLQYVIGRWDFHGMPVALARGVLIPRPETEVVLEHALARIPQAARGRAVDMGSGSGILAVALAKHRPGLAVEAWDLSDEAVRLTRRNARLARVDVAARRADLRSEPLPDRSLAVILSNPPYIASGEIAGLDASVRDHEPRLALDGGPDGLEAVRWVLDRAARALEPGGLVVIEIGADQGERAREEALARGAHDVEVARDLAGRWRALSGRW